jgi:hypothetical protein
MTGSKTQGPPQHVTEIAALRVEGLTAVVEKGHKEEGNLRHMKHSEKQYRELLTWNRERQNHGRSRNGFT